MSEQTDIYINKGSSFTELATLACRLSEKVLDAKQTATIVCASEMDAKSLDETLWSFRDDAFIPHQASTSVSKNYPVAVTHYEALESAADSQDTKTDTLIYLEPRLLSREPTHTRRLILVSNDEKNLNEGRALFKRLKTSVAKIQTHDLRKT